MGPINTQWFVDTLNDKQMSQRGLAKHLGCDPSSVHRLLTGKRPMRLDEAEQLSTLLGKTVGEVLGHAGVPLHDAQTIPVCGYVDGILEVHLDLDVDAGKVERVPGIPGSPPSTIALRALTAGTPNYMIDGWLIIVAPSLGRGEVIPSEVIDRLCMVKLENGQRLIRWVRRGYRSGVWNLDTMMADGSRLRDATLASATPVLALRQV